jgi:hypothetical protein
MLDHNYKYHTRHDICGQQINEDGIALARCDIKPGKYTRVIYDAAKGDRLFFLLCLITRHIIIFLRSNPQNTYKNNET